LILSSVLRLAVAAFAFSLVCIPALAQTPDPQIELNVMTLPTTQSLRPKQSYFRLTHRFHRDLTVGDFSDLAKDLFAFDNGALLGLEYRIGVAPGIHAGLHRSTLHKTLQLFGRWDAVRQGEDSPFGISAFGTFEGLDNLQDGYQPGVGAVLSKTFGRAIALYASPMYVWGTFDAEQVAAELGEDPGHDHLVPAELEPHGPEDPEHEQHEGEGTFFFGLGARVRVRPSVFVLGEFSPRVSGHDPGETMWGVAIEKSTRGHTLALTLTNSYATTPGQIARGGTPGALYLGFNITRKF
jgi:Membrane bound beta barrel domain (DUF5777)